MDSLPYHLLHSYIYNNTSILHSRISTIFFPLLSSRIRQDYTSQCQSSVFAASPQRRSVRIPRNARDDRSTQNFVVGKVSHLLPLDLNIISSTIFLDTSNTTALDLETRSYRSSVATDPHKVSSILLQSSQKTLPVFLRSLLRLGRQPTTSRFIT